jgi:hypothetical protein
MLFLLFISYSKAQRIVDVPPNKRRNNTTLDCPYDPPRTTPASRDCRSYPVEEGDAHGDGWVWCTRTWAKKS